MAEHPVRVELIDRTTVRFTLTCGECGALSSLTVDDVPPVTRSIAATMFTTPGNAGRLRVQCGRCKQNAELAARADDRRDHDRHAPRTL